MGSGAGLRVGASRWVRVGTRGAPKPHGAPLPPQELPPPWMLDVDSQKPPKGKWSTPPFDPRFPNQNQTQNCYQNFLGETLRASLGAGGETGEAGRGAPHLKMGRRSGTRLGGGDRWGGKGWGRTVVRRGGAYPAGAGPGVEGAGPSPGGRERRGLAGSGRGLAWRAMTKSWRGGAWSGVGEPTMVGWSLPGVGGAWSGGPGPSSGGAGRGMERQGLAGSGRGLVWRARTEFWRGGAREGEAGPGWEWAGLGLEVVSRPW